MNAVSIGRDHRIFWRSADSIPLASTADGAKPRSKHSKRSPGRLMIANPPPACRRNTAEHWSARSWLVINACPPWRAKERTDSPPRMLIVLTDEIDKLVVPRSMPGRSTASIADEFGLSPCRSSIGSARPRTSWKPNSAPTTATPTARSPPPLTHAANPPPPTSPDVPAISGVTSVTTVTAHRPHLGVRMPK